jgi:galacturonosyltransferase
MPSYHEGMSNVNLESAANGRPVITTNVPGCRETIDDGRTGFLVEAKSTESLINGVERFLALSYEQKVLMGQMARKKVENEFDRQIVIDSYIKELKTIG